MKCSGEDKATWLELARRQSQLAASARADRSVAFDWSAVQTPTRGGTIIAGHRWLLILLPVVLALGATATWAFVSHLRQLRHQRTPSVVAPRTQPAAAAAPGAGHRAPSPARDLPAAAPAAKATTAKATTAKATTRSRRRAPERRRPAFPVRKGTEQVTIDDEVIIIAPPARMRPLWTPDSYLRR